MIDIPKTALSVNANTNINLNYTSAFQNHKVNITEYKKYTCSRCNNEDKRFVYKSRLCTQCDLKNMLSKAEKTPNREFSKATLYSNLLDDLDNTNPSPADKKISTEIKDKNPRTTFSFELVNLLQESNNPNIIVSPSSVIRTLILLSLGSSGATKKQLFNLFDKIDITIPENLLSISNNTEANDSLLPNYLARIQEENKRSWFTSIINKFWSTTDNTARLDNFNAVLTNDGFALSENMKKKLAALKAVGADQVLSNDDFIKDINEIFAIKTNGNVQEIVRQGDFTGTEIAILNAIHFYGKWKSAFKRDDYDLPFFLSANKLIPLKYMSLTTTDYKMASFENWQAIRLFYKGDKYAMDIILPPQVATTENNDASTSRIISQLTFLLNSEQNTSPQEKINIKMPSFSFSSETNLLDIMRQHPELKPLTHPGLNLGEMIQGGYEGAITKVLQKCYIDVNEIDTQATAVTEMLVSKSIDQKQFFVSQPFYFSLSDTKNNDIAMAGFVQNPSIN